ncbi:hypothetical protein SUNI508_08451 [Seiridium unicorne]|uniref:AMP-dependent synthetase/ligase domain-containing protein n=1 Tax=Seiridium unicorne TaxID=138068 RepID=A0ABR2UTR8_9PEZI
MAAKATTPEESAVQSALQARTVPEFIEHGRYLTTKALGFPGQHATDIAYYTPRDLFKMARKAAQIYTKAGLSGTARSRQAVVALRGKSTIEWVVSSIALIELGYTIFAVSPGLAPKTVAILMEKVNCSTVIDGTSMTDKGATEALRNTPQMAQKTVISLLGLDRLSDTRAENTEDNGENIQNGHDNTQRWSHISPSDIALILHSSGSTGQPKLIPKTHNAVMSRLRGLPSRMHGATFMTSWLYYSVGFHSMLFALLKTGGPSVWASEQIAPNAQDYRKILTELHPRTAWFNGGSLFAAMSTSEGLDALGQCDIVVTTGQVMPKQLGDQLVKSGVRLVNLYGMTELSSGLIPASQSRSDPDWEYLRPDPAVAQHVCFRPRSDLTGTETAMYEFVVLPSHPTQDKSFANQPDGSFHTGDLFVQHPTRTDWFKCIGRMSETIRPSPDGLTIVDLHSLAYEHAVLAVHRSLLQEVMLFGNDRPEPGLLLFTVPNCAIATDEIIDMVYDTLQKEFSSGTLPMAVKRSMLIVIRDVVVPRTGKGTLVRPEVYRIFENDIDEAYNKSF